MEDLYDLMSQYANVPDKVCFDKGDYKVKIKEMRPAQSKNNAENVGLNLELEFVDGPYQGKSIFDNLCFTRLDKSKDSMWRARALAKTRGLFAAGGFVPDFSNLAGQQVGPEQSVKIATEYIKPNLMGKVVVATVAERDGDNEVKQYNPVEETGVTAPPQSVGA